MDFLKRSWKREIVNKVYSVGAIDWDRKYFDEIISLPDGTSYNSYLIEGSEKTALIDTVDPSKKDLLIEHLNSVDRIDYIISNHAEQDHSGSIPDILKKYPMAKLVTNELCAKMLNDELELPQDRIIIIKDNEELSLGDKTLKFIFTPWVHWPETMCTFLKEDKLLFTCDFFGSHLATSDLYASETSIESAAKRYYSEIMMPFANIIIKNLERVRSLNPHMICPSHGPIYSNPNFIISLYEEWTSKNVKPKIVITYISMHGSTKRIVEYLISCLIEKGFKVQECNLIDADTGKIAMDLVDASTLIIGSPSFLGGMHPRVSSAIGFLNALHPKTKIIGYVGSYEWGSQVKDKVSQSTNNFHSDYLEPLLVKGLIKEDHYNDVKNFAEQVYQKHVELGLIETTKIENATQKNNLSNKSSCIIKKVHDETHNVKTFVLERPQGFEYLAGQYVMLQFNDGRVIDKKNSIPITLSSSPLEQDLKLTIKKTGSFTTELFSLKKGDLLKIKGPLGDTFNFDESHKENLVLLSGGSGVTPFISIMRFINEKSMKNSVIMINGNFKYEDIIFREELDSLSHDNIYIMNTLGKYDDSWRGEKGYITKEMILKYVKIPNEYVFCICGSPSMMLSIRKILFDIGVQEDKIRFDKWEIPVKKLK